MSSKTVREIARAFLIEQGAGYYRAVLVAAGVDRFSKLPAATLRRLAAESAHWVEFGLTN